MSFIILPNGTRINSDFFYQRLNELKREEWILKDINELPVQHLNCELTFETISVNNSKFYYESNLGSFISVLAYESFIKKNV